MFNEFFLNIQHSKNVSMKVIGHNEVNILFNVQICFLHPEMIREIWRISSWVPYRPIAWDIFFNNVQYLHMHSFDIS